MRSSPRYFHNSKLFNYVKIALNVWDCLLFHFIYTTAPVHRYYFFNSYTKYSPNILNTVQHCSQHSCPKSRQSETLILLEICSHSPIMRLNRLQVSQEPFLIVHLHDRSATTENGLRGLLAAYSLNAWKLDNYSVYWTPNTPLGTNHHHILYPKHLKAKGVITLIPLFLSTWNKALLALETLASGCW